MRTGVVWGVGIALGALLNAVYGAMHFGEDPEGSLGNFAASAVFALIAIAMARPSRTTRPEFRHLQEDQQATAAGVVPQAAPGRPPSRA
jgi:hypothetical protein